MSGVVPPLSFVLVRGRLGRPSQFRGLHQSSADQLFGVVLERTSYNSKAESLASLQAWLNAGYGDEVEDQVGDGG
jgi:hypothetical protein